MAETFVSMRNLKFLIYELNNAEALCAYPYFEEHNREIFDLVLDTALKMGTDDLYPRFVEMDREQPTFDAGTISVNPWLREFMAACGEGGWIGANAPFEHGGQQIPDTVMVAFRFIFGAANYSASAYPFLGTGAALLMISFASRDLIDTYVPNIFEGKWQGTMALTEPHAGSSLTDLKTTATRTDEGYFNLVGQKIFISCGEHNAVDNIVHLMIARIEGAPAGIKGISLFVVPKLRPCADGTLESNDLICTATFHKLGYKGAPITQLEMGEHGDCRAWLVGEENRGLSYMFQMMNEARVGVGAGATATATAAYYASLEYTRERAQGRPITAKDPATPQIPIIEHADVKRMLLFQRAITEGSLSLVIYCSNLIDRIHAGPAEDKERLELLLDFLTPIAKTYPSEMGILSVSTGLQCLGGYGYCDEFPLEQLYRDIRIHPIHEGTTGIQGMDLLGRKVTMKNGQALMIYIEEITACIKKAKGVEAIATEAQQLEEALAQLQQLTMHLGGLAMKGEIDLFLADATLYLEYVGIITIGWQWLWQATVSEKALAECDSEADNNFYMGKRYACHYFFRYELPKLQGLAMRLQQSDGLTLSMQAAYFEN